MIKVKGLEYKYPNNKDWTINNSSFTIKQGEITTIIGSNGSGKTTLAYLLSGLLELKKPSKGEISIDSKVGLVFQNPDIQIICNSVYKEISFVLKNHNVKNEDIPKKIQNSLKLVGMENRLNDNPLNFSLGQKQKIAIACVLALNPKYIVFDESTSFLDPSSKEQMLSIYTRLKNSGIGVVVITNLIDELFISDKLLYFDFKNTIRSFEDKVLGNEKQVSNILQDLGFSLTPLWKLNLLASGGDKTAKNILEKVRLQTTNKKDNTRSNSDIENL